MLNMQTITVKQGQSLLDIAITYTGTVESCFEISILNQMSVTDILSVGQQLIVPDVINKNVVILFSEKNQPATGLTAAQNNEIPVLKGIGYMQIGKTFKTS
jgi:LysM repeat protein